MDTILNAVEVRVLGALIEKQLTTPEYYPLTLNGLTNACNQLSNRDPVVSYDDKTVAGALESLREKKLVWMVTAPGNRVPKYEHRAIGSFNLSPAEVAVLCVLLLRGSQTVGEIRGRTGRMHQFQDLEEVEATMEGLQRRKGGPLVTRLPRQPGAKESRYAHLLSGEVEAEQAEAQPRLERATIEVRSENERIANLEREVQALRSQLEELSRGFHDFKKQFE